MRIIEIPPVYLPGTEQISSVRISIELVNAQGQGIIGFDADADAGYARPRTLSTTDAVQTVELPTTSELEPDSLWKFTLTAGSVSEEYLVTLEDGVTPITLPDLLHPEVTP